VRRPDDAPSRRVLVAAGGVVAACVLLFLLIAEDVLDGGGIVAHDEAVLRWFVDHRTDAWITAARAVSTFGSFVSLAILGGLLAVWLLTRRAHPVLAVAPLLALVLGSLVSTLAKGVFGRPRPPVELHAATVTLAAFPSSHATDAAAFFVAAALVVGHVVARSAVTRVLLVVGGAVLAGLVGLSRLVLAVHWLSDVVAGWALGTAVAVIVVVGARVVASRWPRSVDPG
jgi:undecaprenyl-diphosphatase